MRWSDSVGIRVVAVLVGAGVLVIARNFGLDWLAASGLAVFAYLAVPFLAGFLWRRTGQLHDENRLIQEALERVRRRASRKQQATRDHDAH